MFILRFFICICMMFSVSAVAEGIDHKPFDDLLRAHVKNGQVDYPAFQNNAAFDVYVEASPTAIHPMARCRALIIFSLKNGPSMANP
jgi:hypothetical protein